MAESASPTFQGSLIQLKEKIISASGNSIMIRKGNDATIIRERQIFKKSKIQFLLPIGDENGKKAFFLSISSKRIALFQLKKNSPIVTFKFDEKIMEHGLAKVLDIGIKKDDGTFRLRLTIPLVFRSGTLRKMRFIVHFLESQVIKQKIKCLEEVIVEDKKLQRCVALGNNTIFGFYEDTVVKSDGTVMRAGEPSTKKKRRIAVVSRELWHGNILLATENGSIRVVRVKDERKAESDSLSIISERQCIPSFCTLRCRQPSAIISMENSVIVGTQRGDIHFLNDRLELIRKIEIDDGPISYLKFDENDIDFLWVGYESGELRRIKWIAPDQNEASTFDHNIAENQDIFDMEVDDSGEKENDSQGCNLEVVVMSYDETETAMKKVNNRKRAGLAKKSDTYLECPEKGCYYKTLSCRAFEMHLRKAHRTTPVLAGLVFRCQCGFEAISWNHSSTCIISNFTVVRKPDFGPTRTFVDKITPQCTLCKVYPRSVGGFGQHIYKKHNSSLEEIGCYLNCRICDRNCYTVFETDQHSKKCKSRIYSLLKLGEGAEKEDETEMDQNADAPSSVLLVDG